ncbi:MAG: PH domain-containing protein [Bacilli bacterium]|nr:PH domain-containing protein [Bacilli bacterium]
MKKNKTVLQCVLEFKKRYPSTIMWRVKRHAAVIEKHLNPKEKVLYAFAAQKNDNATKIFDTAVLCVTSDRIIIAQDQILYGYTLDSITPEMYNDLSVFSGIFWGKITIDTVKEVVTFSNFTKRALPEIESIISMYMMEAKKLYPNNDKISSVIK